MSIQLQSNNQIPSWMIRRKRLVLEDQFFRHFQKIRKQRFPNKLERNLSAFETTQEVMMGEGGDWFGIWELEQELKFWNFESLF